MSAEPTDEQRQAAVEAIGYFWHPDVWDNLCSCYPRRDHPVPGDDCILLTAENVARALAAAVTAEREKYLRVAKQCDVEAARERQYSTERLDEGNEPASLVCTGMSIGWEHAARRIRGVTP